MCNMEEFEKKILLKLSRRNIWGSKHMRFNTLLKCGWEPHKKGLVKDAVKSLLKKGLIIWAKKEKKALQLNKEKSKEITNITGEQKWQEQ